MSTEWKLVPHRLTTRMGHAGEAVLDADGSLQALWDAMIAAAPQHPASVSQWPTWQPLETAPKDGTSILLITAAGIVEAAWAHGSWEQSVIECSYAGAGWPVFACQPTHWMPLPPAPAESAQPADVARLVGAPTPAARDVLAERQRQIEVEGWTPEHDDEHTSGELAQLHADLRDFLLHVIDMSKGDHYWDAVRGNAEALLKRAALAAKGGA